MLRTWLSAVVLAAGSAVAAPFAYIPDGNFKVSVVDLGTNTVATKITGEWLNPGIAVSRVNNRAYISSWFTNTIQVVDTTTNSTIATIDVCGQPGTIALNAAGTKLIVPCFGLIPPSLIFSMVIDTTTFQTTLVGPTLGASTSAWNDAGGKFYVASNQRIFSFDSASLNFRKQLGVPDGVFGLAVNVAGTRLYAASSKSADGTFGENTLTVYDAASDNEMKRVPLPANSGWIAIDPSGSRLYVPLVNDTVAVFDADGNAVTTVQLPAGTAPRSVAVSADGSRVYVQGAGSLITLQAPAYATLATVALGSSGAGYGSFVGNGSTAAAPNLPGVLSGVWWNPAQSGWGIGLTQRGTNIFATWFTYDIHGKPTWHVSTCKMATPLNCVGTLFQITGTRFDFSGPYDARFAETHESGSIQMVFIDGSHGTMKYEIGDVDAQIDIQRQPLAAQGPYPAVNYTDLWWNPDQSGWGIQITQQRNTLFLAWFVYDDAFKPMWYVMSCATNAAGNSCTGPVYRTTGPDFDTQFDPALVRAIQVGTMTVNFTGPNDGVLTYTVDGVSGTKNVTRQLF